MSNIYIQEPPTDGKVLLITSLGEIDIELWSREAPKACRNFIQLCMEKYYDGTIFHRVINDFIAQGGDPTGTGEGGESIYGKPFRDEIHSRLRFVRRGLVAMANAGKNDNGSQFFFTLGPTQELQGKHTIFGKVTGETIYNLIRFNDVDTDGNDRPVDPPKIKKAQVLLNPFDDIVPRETIKHEKESKKNKKDKVKVKGKKDFKLLSFGAEAEEDEEETNQVVETLRTSGKSAHDLANDPKLSKESGEIDENIAVGSTSKEELDKPPSDDQPEDKSHETLQDVQSSSKKSRIEQLREERIKLQKELKGSKNKSDNTINKSDDEDDKTKPEAVQQFLKEKAVYDQKKKDLKRKDKSSREQQTLLILERFKSKLHTVSTLNDGYADSGPSKKPDESNEREGDDDDDDEDINDDGWLSHKLEFGDAHSKVLDANVTDVERYKIYDPRNPMTKRRREEAEKDAKRKRLQKESKI